MDDASSATTRPLMSTLMKLLLHSLYRRTDRGSAPQLKTINKQIKFAETASLYNVFKISRIQGGLGARQAQRAHPTTAHFTRPHQSYRAADRCQPDTPEHSHSKREPEDLSAFIFLASGQRIAKKVHLPQHNTTAATRLRRVPSIRAHLTVSATTVTQSPEKNKQITFHRQQFNLSVRGIYRWIQTVRPSYRSS